ncbi:MAG: MATE family efflux transporter [Eubacteriales bacterium]|nr:MATE family efflux transporter [Eubacteriales bacterium]
MTETVLQTKENKMGTMPVLKLLINMAVPMMISMMVQALYNVVDSIFVSILSKQALEAVTFAFPVQNLMISVGVGIGVGINALLSKALGEKKHKTANEIAMQGLLLNSISYVLFLILGIFATKQLVSSQTADPSIIQQGTEYLRICLIFSFGLFMQITFERFLQSTGKTLLAMVVQICGAVINIILDPILIFGLFGFPKMGIAGAAIATVIGQIIAGIIGFILNIKYNHEIKLSFSDMKPKPKTMWNILYIAVPSILLASIGSITTYAMNKILNKYDNAVAVFGVYFRLQSFIFMPVFGLNNGMVPIIAYNYGARNKERILKTIKCAMIIAVSIMLFGLILFNAIPEVLLGMFNADASMIVVGSQALRRISLSFMFAGVSIICISVCQAFGYSIYGLVVSVLRQLVVLIPLAYLLSLVNPTDPVAIWFAFPLAEIVAIIVSFICIKKVFKKVNL